jgi:hypothetical protein
VILRKETLRVHAAHAHLIFTVCAGMDLFQQRSGHDRGAEAALGARNAGSHRQSYVSECARQQARHQLPFRSLTVKVSVSDVVEKCGRPDEELGSGLYIFVWHMPAGSTVSIGTPHLERIGPVRLTDAFGKTTILPRKK